MDHDHDHDHGGGGGTGVTERTCKMIMTFHGGHCEKVLWKSWLAYDLDEFIWSALALFAIAFIYEGIKFGRELHCRKTIRAQRERALALQIKNGHGEGSNSNTPLSDGVRKTYLEQILSGPHLVQTLINVIQVTISYFLMLVFMLFNYWLCLAVILGLGLGYFLFGWIKQEKYDDECCH